ncbi:hypothetical protein ACIRQQ_32905 [Streptomyces fuscichromogenes]|uniref:hypothetical protein n=1 Tax=Streptomyces fuscichromogenes TaxID=1324013 RepID=UPI003822E425
MTQTPRRPEEPVSRPASPGPAWRGATGRARHWLTRDHTALWIWTCLLGMCGSLVAAGRAALAFSGVPDPGDQCGALGADTDFIRVAIRVFPPSARCVFRQHPSFELVPSWVSPVLIVCLVATVLGGIAAIHGTLRTWMSTRRQTPGRT